MLPDYGVVVGTYAGVTTNQGRWLHVDLAIDAGGSRYQAAVDVNEPNGVFEYQVIDNLATVLFLPVGSFADGWHRLAPNETSGAIDYARSPILQGPPGCLSIFWSMWRARFGGESATWIAATGNEAGEALIEMVTGSKRLFVFGAPYTTGLGVHDVHCNQGDPPGPHRRDDGIWQDGCVFVQKADGSLSAYLGKFSTQTLKTDQNGVPL